MTLTDVTDETPRRRMSVARGTLVPGPGAADLGVAEAAATQAVKQSDAWIPTQHAFQPTHVQVDAEAAETITVTVTVQGFARTGLDTAALSGVAAALLTLRQQTGGGAMTMDLVQNVD